MCRAQSAESVANCACVLASFIFVCNGKLLNRVSPDRAPLMKIILFGNHPQNFGLQLFESRILLQIKSCSTLTNMDRSERENWAGGLGSSYTQLQFPDLYLACPKCKYVSDLESHKFPTFKSGASL